MVKSVADESEKMVRTSITIPESMKKQMDELDINWSAVMRQAIKQKLEGENQVDVIEALLLNEKLKKTAPEGWDSVKVIRAWRRRRS
jgi:hypothetical protein